MSLLNNNKMREWSFFINISGVIIGTVFSGIVLLFITNMNESVKANETSDIEMKVEFGKKLTEIETWMKDQNEKHLRLRDRMDRFDYMGPVLGRNPKGKDSYKTNRE